MAEMEGNHSGAWEFMKGLLVGGAVGAVAAILLAPKSGKELREDIVQKGEQTYGQLRNFASDARDKAQAILDDARQRADELKREANRQLAEARLKAREVLRGAQEKAAETMREPGSEPPKGEGRTA